MSFSNGGGGTLALPSPTHRHHQIDVTSAVRTLRRSISRSPSKFLSRSVPHGSEASRPASPQSPCRRLGVSTPQNYQQYYLPGASQTQSAPPTSNHLPHTSTPRLAPALTPLRSSVKLSLRSAKSAKTASPSRPLARARASPKSPLRRALNSSSDTGNQVSYPPSSWSPMETLAGQENKSRLPVRSPITRRNLEKSSRHSLHLDVTGTSQTAFLKALDANLENLGASSTGALKRSDATMNLDQPNQGSPVAKRRSLHGISIFGQKGDFNVMSPAASVSGPVNAFDIHEDGGAEYELTNKCEPSVLGRDSPTFPTPPSNLPRRSSSLRKSTLQQRYGDKNSFGRRMGERQLAQMGNNEPSTPARLRPRLSTDHFRPPPPAPRESIFSSTSPLPNPSFHPLDNKTSHQPHPLRKTLTTSTSGNTLTEETSLYAPAARAPRGKSHPFSQSLPVNAPRPTAYDPNNDVASTPNGAGLWQPAFRSTGLISKVNRNPELDDKKMAPPDTPCKKAHNNFATFPPPIGSALKKKKTASKNNNRNSFGGLPSTPFSTPFGEQVDTFGNPGKGLSIFQRASASRSARRGNFLFFDENGDENLFGDSNGEPIPLASDIPPTPTKNTLTPSLSDVSEESIASPTANRTMPPPSASLQPVSFRRSTFRYTPEGPERPDAMANDALISTSPHRLANNEGLTKSKSFLSSSSSWGLLNPGPIDSPHLTQGSLQTPHGTYAKISYPDTTTPASGRRTPQTPQESELPLDTSRLSISLTPSNRASMGKHTPVTPTARDFKSSTSSFVTPVGRQSHSDADAALYSRFEKVEQIGKGEFSNVFRVTRVENRVHELFSATPGTPPTPARSQVFAVKKSRRPYTGQRDREVKLREVDMLRKLTQADHVVHYVDHWELNGHMYIQTEFCEEGSLSKFLSDLGYKGRLDDFRIFKALQDLCLGLKEIHDAGLMHLDMKPANVFVTFEGALKIGDFGLAQHSDSVKSVDIEGDREYMAPEMLQGKANRSCDVFSLGLMILEAAANVMLPDNGPSWIRLRSGDLSEVPSLTWTPSSEVHQDGGSVHGDDFPNGKTHNAANLFGGSYKRSELQQPPAFMIDKLHPSSLDSIVAWMTAQAPGDRPTVEQILDLEGLQWVAERRQAPATVFEGHWGPGNLAQPMIAGDEDTEMTDV